jgi:hypothetical protein
MEKRLDFAIALPDGLEKGLRNRRSGFALRLGL